MGTLFRKGRNKKPAAGNGIVTVHSILQPGVFTRSLRDKPKTATCITLLFTATPCMNRFVKCFFELLTQNFSARQEERVQNAPVDC